MMTWEEVVAIVRHRQINRSPLLEAMLGVRQRYNAEWVLPYPTDEDAPDLPSTTPLMIADAIDFAALRAGSSEPTIAAPALSTGTRHMEYATMRRTALRHLARTSRQELQLRRAYRHLKGYASTCLQVQMDNEVKGGPHPTWMARDPLGCYPEDKAPEDLSPIANCAFVYAKSADWIRRNYPEALNSRGGPVPDAPIDGIGEMWDIAEWIDEDQCIFGILGPRLLDALDASSASLSTAFKLGSYTNFAGMCTVVTPHAVTLDRIFSQMQALVGTVDLYGKLQALSVVATEKSIFPDTYLLGDSGQTPMLVSGPWKDGRTGDVNMLQNVSAVGQLRSTPDPTNQNSIDRLERNVRVSSGTIPQQGGETYGALRTGRANDSMFAAAVDPAVAEMHGIIAPDLERVNEIAMEMWKHHPLTKSKTFSLYARGEVALVDFIPEKHIETSLNSVTYPIPGADAQGTTINLGQMTGAGMMSRRTAMNKHPYIDNPENEARFMVEEQLEDAVLAAISQKASTGELPIELIVELEAAVKEAPDVIAAFRLAEDRVRKAQAEVPEIPVGPDGQPMPSPEMQPGLEGMPSPAGQAPVMPGPMPGEMGPTSNQEGLQALLGALAQQPTPGPEQPVPI